MKSIEDLLRNLARPEVLEFGLVTNRLPSVNIGGRFEPVDDEAPSNERVRGMLAAIGGQRHLDGPADKPLQWTTRLEGLGTLAIAAIVREDVIQARITVLKREAQPPRDLAGPAPPAPAVPTPTNPIQPQPIHAIGLGGQAAGPALAPPGPPPPPPMKSKTAPIGSALASTLAQAAAQAAGDPRGDFARTLKDPPLPPPTDPSAGAPATEDDDEPWRRDDDEPTVQTLSPPVAGRPGDVRVVVSKPAPVAPPATTSPPPAEASLGVPESARTQIIAQTQRGPASPPSAPSAGARAPEPPLPKVEITAPVDTFLQLAVAARASDLFIVAGRPLLLRIALDLSARTQPILAEHVERMAKEIVPPRLRESLDRDGACDFAIEHPAHGRFRVHVAKQRAGYELALRVIPRELPSLGALALPEALLRTMREPGLVLLASPTGHGRSTTLAALVDHLNRERAVHILLLEEPIEHVHPRRRALVTQRDLGLHVRKRLRGFASALREDPDVVAIADLRDTDGARLALSAAEAGRLVLATLAAGSPTRAVEQVLDCFGGAERGWARTTLARSLRAVVGQRLVPNADRTKVFPALEIVPWSAQLSGAVRAGRTDQIADVLAGGKAFGIQRLEDSLSELVRSERVTLEAAKRAAPSPALLDKILSHPGGQSVPPGPPRKG